MLEKHNQTLIDELCEFVRIPSRSSPTGGEEGALQRVIAERMSSIGARVRVFEASDLPGFLEHELCRGPDR